MGRITKHLIPAAQLDLLSAVPGMTHDMLSFDAEFRASAFHAPFVGMRRLILPDQHYKGSEPYHGDATVISTEWHQRDSDDYHSFAISRHSFAAQPDAADWVRPFRLGLGAKVARVEVFSARFTIEYSDGREHDTIVYDKFIRFTSTDGSAVTLTTAHGSILGEIEIRTGHMFAALGEGPDSMPERRVTLD